MDGQNFCLKWDAYQSSVTSVFDRLRQDEELVDITLCCEGQSVRAHRVVLSACSPYFRDLLRNNPCQQMVFFLKDTSVADLYGIVEFMYKGSVNVAQSQLASFLKTAEMLQIRGLSSDENTTSTRAPDRRASPSSPPARKRARQSPSSVVSPGRNRSCSTEPSCKREDSAEDEELAVPESPRGEDGAVSGALSVDGGGVSANRGAQHQSAVPDSFPVSSLSRSMSSFSSVVAAQADEFRRRAGNIKTEKPELDVPSEDDASLDATLGLVTDFENHSNGAFGESIGAAGGDRGRGPLSVLPYSAGPSHRHGDDTPDKGKKKYSCDICGKTYGYRDSVYRHKRTHEGKTACFVCGKILSCLPTLREHLRFQHNLSQEEVACLVTAAPRPAGLAAAAAAAASGLADNTAGTLGVESGCVKEVASHAQERPHVCAVCGRRYRHRVSLCHHIKKHEGRTTCTLCGKVLGITAHLRVHLATVHGLDKEGVRALVPTRSYAPMAVPGPRAGAWSVEGVQDCGAGAAAGEMAGFVATAKDAMVDQAAIDESSNQLTMAGSSLASAVGNVSDESMLRCQK